MTTVDNYQIRTVSRVIDADNTAKLWYKTFNRVSSMSRSDCVNVTQRDLYKFRYSIFYTMAVLWQYHGYTIELSGVWYHRNCAVVPIPVQQKMLNRLLYIYTSLKITYLTDTYLS